MAGEDAFRPDIPSTARMYDYYLGGKDNYPADREAAEKVMAALPPGAVQTAARENRQFLGRVVRYLAGELKIRQFLDIGTGLPTMNQVHEVAQSVDPGCRVVYADHDPVVLAHARDMLNGLPATTILRQDLRDPEELLADPGLRAVLDFREPVALLLIAILHFITDDEHPRKIIQTLTKPLPSGSYLVISHVTADAESSVADGAAKVYERTTSRLTARTRAEISALFDGFDLIDPGIVWIPQWRPDANTGSRDDPSRSQFYCGVARKP